MPDSNLQSQDAPPDLEVIACSLEDAVAAQCGGASRLEVTVRLDRDGLTPPLELVREILAHVSIPARVMLRDREDFSAGSPEEFERLKRKAIEFTALKLDGFVTGFVRDGQWDLTALKQLIDLLPGFAITAHHAVEATVGPTETLLALRKYPNVDRALVSGGKGELAQRIQRLPQFREAFGTDRDLIVGGGLTLDMLQPIGQATGIRCFHLGRAVRTPEEPAGVVDSGKVRKAVRLLQLTDWRAASFPPRPGESPL